MIRTIVSGAAGRMGGRIIAIMKEISDLKLVGALENKGHQSIGEDSGEVAGIGKNGINITDDLEKIIKSSDVIIDFTLPSATIEKLRIASREGRAMVIGTTGFTKDELSEVKSLTSSIPCVMAPNMSVGVNLLLKVLADIAKVLKDDYDVEIIEVHHRMKKDAPSGTALKMAQVLADALGRNLDEVGTYVRKGIIGERPKKEIGIQTVRAGDIVGEHTVLFGGLGERIEVAHRVSSRDTFARGALKAAQWIVNKKPGVYDMQDVLGLK